MKKVYIAGPMSGYPQFNIPAFDAAADVLREDFKLEVFSPAEIDGPVSRDVLLASEHGSHHDLPPTESWSFYLARDFRILVDQDIDTIVTLPGWKDSKGARLEVALGEELGIPHVEYIDLDSQLSDPPSGLYQEDRFVRYDEHPDRQRAVTGAVKDNRGKSRLDLIPTLPLIAAGDVLAYGAKKYKPHNWRLGLGWSDTFASLQRHLWAFNNGEDLDPETGLPHLAHAMCQLMFLTEFYLSGTGQDDRFTHIDKEGAKA